MAFPEAFKELRARNLAVATVYREWSRRLPPGPVSKLAASIAEQRRDLDKALAEIAADQSPRGAEVEFELAPAQAEGVSSEDSELSEPKAILRKIVAAEAADHDLLAEAAGSALSLSTEIAERLAAEAASARKRSIWAQDQLELMEML
jgi:predicted phage gp36 major capsid-like protein